MNVHILKEVQKENAAMKYVSTRGSVEPTDFAPAVRMGLADDGGLLIPQSIPHVADRLEDWRTLSYSDLALQVMSLYIGDIPSTDLKALIDATYGPAFDPQVAPVVRVGPVWVLELWHGPTLSFKDVALQFLGNLFAYILTRQGGRLNILGATSGDTGSAAIAGCRGRANIDIFMMHPLGRVSDIQQRQMTTVRDDNVHNVAVEGSFDDCQRIMKQLAGDLDFKRAHSLGAVNSVNWARVLAQIVYYFKAVFDVQKQTGAEQVNVAVPTGNFGDVLAGWYAKQMGLPIGRLILATNENDILARFYKTGVYSRSNVHQTLAPAMDIQVASNFERYLYYKVGCQAEKLRQLMKQFAATGSLEIAPGAEGVVDAAFTAGVAARADVLATIRKYHERQEYLLDPHTAVGVSVAEKLSLDDGPVICLATAHPAKFPEAIREATGKDIAHHPAIDILKDLPTRCEVLSNDIQAMQDFIVKTVG